MESAIRRRASSFSGRASRMLVDREGRSSGTAFAGGSTVSVGDDSDEDVVEEMGSIIGGGIPEELATRLARKKMKKANHDFVLSALWSPSRADLFCRDIAIYYYEPIEAD